MLVEAFNLCQKLCGLFDTKGACFHYNIKQCNGACIQKEESDIYNQRVLQATEPYRFNKQDYLVIDKGRSNGEKSIICVEHGKYKGFGFLNIELNENISVAELRENVKPFPDHRDIQHILRNYLKRNKVERIIEL